MGSTIISSPDFVIRSLTTASEIEAFIGSMPRCSNSRTRGTARRFPMESLTWRRLTLHVEAATSARAWGAVFTGCFARHDGREVDGTPRSDVLDETSSAT